VLGDLADPASLGTAAEQVAALTDTVDVLVHNAGIYVPSLERLPVGAERTFVTNQLGAFALTHHLAPLLPDFLLGKRFMLTPEQGADTVVWLATTDEDRGEPGGYFVRRQRCRQHRRALDDAMASRLWDRCASMVALPALR
jgi:NAD(P)-dependent dehydrogenase (short-subunit alcohol dehydrogenase family)